MFKSGSFQESICIRASYVLSEGITMDSRWGMSVWKKHVVVVLVLALLTVLAPVLPIENVQAADDDQYIWGMIFDSDGNLLPYDTDFRVWVRHNGFWRPFPRDGSWDPVGTMGGFYSYTLPWDRKGINWTDGDQYRIQIDCTPSGGLAENTTSNGTGSAGDPVSPRGSYNNIINWSTGGGLNNSQQWDVMCSNVDLIPTNIKVNGQPYSPPIVAVPFNTVNISAMVMNDGRPVISESNTIALLNEMGAIGEDTAMTIDEGGSVGPFFFEWDPVSGGDFCFNMTVDYYGNVTEMNENNNSEMICVSIGTLDVTFHDLAPITNTFPGDVNATMIWLEMTASDGDVQVNSIDFTLGGDNIQPSEISGVALWDDMTGPGGPDQKPQWFECELAWNPVDSLSFRIPQSGDLKECFGLGNYVVDDLETRYILVLLSVDATAEPFVDRINVSVDAINADGIIYGGIGTTKTIDVNTVLFGDDVESGQGIWTREGWDKGHMYEPEGLWHLSSGEEDCKNNMFGHSFYNSHNTSWWYGQRYEDPFDPGTYICSYYTWMPADYLVATHNMGNLTTPNIDATGATVLAVTFWHLLYGEPDTPLIDVDTGHIWVHNVTNDTWHRITSDPYDHTDSSWVKETLDLSAFAGKIIQLEFRFDTVDRLNNMWLGWFIDDITVYGRIVPPILPPAGPSTTTNDDDVLLEWTPSNSTALGHYLIYRATDQRDFDFSNPIYNTSMDVDPLRTDWTDNGALAPDSSQEYYYVVRSVSTDGRTSVNSATAGIWNKTFKKGLNAFSLPLQPFDEMNISWFADAIPNVDFIRWMDSTGHWITHYPSMGTGVNDFQARMGSAYEIFVSQDVSFAFWGYPASMIRFHEGFGDSITFRNSLSAQIEGNDVNLSWESVSGASRYEIFRSEKRDGFQNLWLPSIANTTVTHWTDPGVMGSQTSEYYYMIIPLDSTGEMGSSTYSVGVLTFDYQAGLDTFALPLKPAVLHSLDWYCDNMPGVIGMAYVTFGVWKFHAKDMPSGTYNALVQISQGYQISVTESLLGRLTFVGW